MFKLLLLLCSLTHIVSSDNKVICIFTNWAWYKSGDEKFLPENIDPDLCTHINYEFATLDSEELIMKPYDTWADIDNEFYARVTAYRQYGIKVLISMGGWNDSAGDKYHRLVSDPAARANFIKNALVFCHQYGFDGINLSWEYPVCPQDYCSDSYASDKDDFTSWVKELAEAFHPEGFLVTADVAADSKQVDTSYDVPSISAYLDLINVMTYNDNHGQWDRRILHVPSLYNMDHSITYWINSGADPLKLTVGIPFYGRSFTFTDPSVNGLNTPSDGGGKAGLHTRQIASPAYYEICYMISQGNCIAIQDPFETIEAYAYCGAFWVSYDDPAMVQTKSEYIISKGLGGAVGYSLDLDDFMNICGDGTYPLLKTINRVLRGYAK